MSRRISIAIKVHLFMRRTCFIMPFLFNAYPAVSHWWAWNIFILQGANVRLWKWFALHAGRKSACLLAALQHPYSCSIYLCPINFIAPILSTRLYTLIPFYFCLIPSNLIKCTRQYSLLLFPVDSVVGSITMTVNSRSGVPSVKFIMQYFNNSLHHHHWLSILGLVCCCPSFYCLFIPT
jgi:hypothetical protein